MAWLWCAVMCCVLCIIVVTMPVLFSLTVTIGGACPYEVDPVFLRPAGWHISHLRRRGIHTDDGSGDNDGGGDDAAT
jgi:hypothetical protein